MGISTTSLYVWKNKYPAFAKALEQGKDVVDRKVENALLKKALQGNVTAQIFWLKNRKPEEWRDRTEKNTAMDAEEQRARIEKLKADTAVAKAKTEAPEEAADDGFLEALKGSAAEDWNDAEEE